MRRTTAAVLAGALAYLAILYRFLSYTERNHMKSGTFVVFSAVMLIVGFLVSLGATGSRIKLASLVIVGVWVGLTIVILIDTSQDPTNHNLLPFEYVFMSVDACPVYIGAGIAAVADRVIHRA